MSDPSPIVTVLLPLLPAGWAVWIGDAITVLSVLCALATLFCAWVRPPSAMAPAWARSAYTAVSWCAGNLGWARSAVVPGMHKPVQEVALLSQKLTALKPEAAVVAQPPAAQPAVLGVPASVADRPA